MMWDAVLYSGKDPTWATPQAFFDKLNEEFHFTLDVCASHENNKCDSYYTIEDNGLEQDWTSEICWCNPPYGPDIKYWIEKADKEKCLTVMLLPSRTDVKWFHNYIYQKREIRFIKGRLKFEGAKDSAPFPSMLIIFDNRND